MATTIEQLETQVNGIKNSLNELKNNVSLSEDEKKKQAETLKSQADEKKQEIENEIKSLEGKADAASVAKKEAAEALLESFNEITDLYTSILNLNESQIPEDGETEDQEEEHDDSEANQDEKKGIFKKAKDWVGDQWKDIWDKDKWKGETKKNLLRTAGFATTGIGLGALIYGGCKRLFGKESREQRKQRRRERREARKAAKEERKKEIASRPFWQRPFGKFLKRTGIGVGVAGGIYGLGKFFGLIGGGDGKLDKADNKSSDKNKFNSYYNEIVNKPENKEKFENYETFGENIDLLYGSIYDRELKAGYEDEIEMQKIAKEQSNGEKHYKGVVPYCLDNQFKNVDNILGQNSSMKYAISHGIDGMINYIKSKGNDFLQLFVNTYLDKLPSWLPFKNVAGSLSDKIDKWKEKNKNAEKEMQYFFRQSIRVQTYLFEKRDQLISKIVKESVGKYGISEKDIVGDDENLKKYVINSPEYQNFINSPISSAVTVLRNYNIFDCEISKEKNGDIKELDKQRDKVLGCKEGEKDILEIINDKKKNGESLTQQDDTMLGNACDEIVKDIDDSILESVEDSAWSIYKDLFKGTKLGDIFGDDQVILEEYLNKSGLEKVFREYKQIITQKKLELQGGKLSNEDKISLAESINDMLALKKEAILGMQTIEKDYDENGNIIYRIPGFLAGSIGNLCKSVKKICHGEFLSGLNYMTSAGLGTGLVITAAGVIYGIRTHKWGVAKVGLEITLLPAEVTYKVIARIKPVRDCIDRVNYPFKFIGEKGPEKLMNLLKDDKILLSKASEIAEGKTKSRFLSKETERIRKEFFGITDNNENVVYKVFDKLITESSNTSAGASYLQSIKGDSDLYETLIKNYDDSPEIRQAISENRPIDELKRVAEQSKLPELIRNNLDYKRIASDLDLLEKQTKNGRELSELSNAEKKQLSNISDFRQALSNMEEKEISITAELLGEFKKGGSTLGDAISQIDTLCKLEGKAIESTILDASGNTIKKDLDDIIKNMDFKELRSCKGKIPGISDDAIESLAKTFEAVHANKTLKFSDNIDEIAKVIKTLKILAKVS